MDGKYKPQPGDRVSLTGTIKTVYGNFVHVVIDGNEGAVEALSSALTLVERPAPAEEWQPGDVVRNADDPEDARTWFLTADEDGGMPWVEGHGAWRERSDLPANLRLLVRDGQPVPQPEPVERCEEDGCTKPVTGHDDEGVPLCADGLASLLGDRPQPGDVVTEEPPVGSVVKDGIGDEATRDEQGWYWSAHGTDRENNDKYGYREDWDAIQQGTAGGDSFTLVRWGSEQ